MLQRKVGSAIVAVTMSIMLVLGLCACSASSNSDSSSDDQAVAATVNGENLYESTVTQFIEDYRYYVGDQDDDAKWAKSLSNSGYDDASGLRSDAIDLIAATMAIRQRADSEGVTVSDDTVTSQINYIKSYYDCADDSDYYAYILGAAFGWYSPSLDFQYFKNSMLLDALYQADVDVTTDQLQAYADENAYTYSGKKSSHILFSTEEDAEAELKILQQSTDLATDFATAAAQLSTDSTYADSTGNVGWDSITSISDEYKAALDELSVGELSGVVQDSNGYHIIYCTDEWSANQGDTIDLDTLPEAIMAKVKSGATTQAQNDLYSEITDSADIVKNPMPSGLDYDVDMSLAGTASGSSSSSAASATSSTAASTSTGTSATSTSDTSSNASTSNSSASGSAAKSSAKSASSASSVSTSDGSGTTKSTTAAASGSSTTK